MSVPTHQPDPAGSEFGAPVSTPGGALPADYLAFALGAVRRHKALAAATFLGCLSILAAYYALAPPLYRAETSILAQRQRSLPSIARSSAADDQPTRAAWEIIHRRENLVDLVRRAGLLGSPPKGEPASGARGAAPRAADAGQAAEDDPEEILVRLLDRRLKVDASDVTIAIELDWPDPQQAYLIVGAALDNFLEARHVQEVTALDEAIAALRGRAAALHDDLAQAIEETRSSLAQDAAPSPPAQPEAPARVSQPHGREELVRLKSMLGAKQRAIADVEDLRRRRLTELQVQYDSRRSVFAEAHPEMVKLRFEMDALTRDSPQITALRAEEQRLREEYQARAAREPPPRPVAASTEAAQRLPAEGIHAAVEQNERVRAARQRHEEIIESLNRAQLDLDTARTAFKHRYKVIWPVQVPKKPVSPNPLKVFGIGGIASLLLAGLVVVGLDWRSGKVLHRWQIERGLDLPILGQRRRE